MTQNLNSLRWRMYRKALEDGWPSADSYDYWLHPDFRISDDELLSRAGLPVSAVAA